MDNQNGGSMGGGQTSNDKTMGILAYLFILVLVPLLMPNRSAFVTYHVNQGLVNCIFIVVLQIALVFLIFVPFIGFLFQLARLLPVVFIIIGIMNVSKGEMKPLPLIGGFKIIG